MKNFFFLLFSFIIIVSCQNKSAPAIADPVKKENAKINSSQKPVKVETNQLDKKVYNPGIVDTLPKYPGGIQKFHILLKKNYVVPKEVIKDEELAHAIFATFIIEKNGTLSDIKIIRDFGYGSGKELVRVLKLSPNWVPAIKDGKSVRYLYSVPYYCK